MFLFNGNAKSGDDYRRDALLRDALLGKRVVCSEELFSLDKDWIVSWVSRFGYSATRILDAFLFPESCCRACREVAKESPDFVELLE